METIFYIIIGILIFVWQIIQESKKAKKAQPPAPPVRNPGQAQVPPPPPGARKPQEPVSFEDLLKQSRDKGRRTYEEKVKPPVPKTIRKAEKAVEAVKKSYMDEEGKSLEKVEEETGKKETKSTPVLSTEEQFAAYVAKKKTANKYAVLLKNKESLKTMFVASEILNRKHF